MRILAALFIVLSMASFVRADWGARWAQTHCSPSVTCTIPATATATATATIPIATATP